MGSSQDRSGMPEAQQRPLRFPVGNFGRHIADPHVGAFVKYRGRRVVSLYRRRLQNPVAPTSTVHHFVEFMPAATKMPMTPFTTASCVGTRDSYSRSVLRNDRRRQTQGSLHDRGGIYFRLIGLTLKKSRHTRRARWPCEDMPSRVGYGEYRRRG